MPKKRTGTTARLSGGRFQGIITLNDGTRKRLDPYPVGTTYAEARRLTAEASEYARVHNLLPTQKPVPQGDPELSMAAWVELWAKLRRARKQTAVRKAEEHYRNHVVPVLGDRHIADWRREHLEDLVNALDRKVAAGAMAWKTAKNIWGTATAMLDDAHRSKYPELRCRDDNPSKSVRGPDRGAKKAKVILYPDELLRLAACSSVPIEWRRLVVVAVYTYARAGELRALEWSDVDLEHGLLHIHRAWNAETKRFEPTKGKAARRVPIEPALMPLLVAMRDERDRMATVAAEDGILRRNRRKQPDGASAEETTATAPRATGLATASGGGGFLFPNMGAASKLSTWLRSRLLQAGVGRVELHQRSETSRRMTFHDCRATGITWLAVNGTPPLQIQMQAGHTDFKTTQGYIQMASTLARGFGTPFPELPAALLGGGERHATERRRAVYAGLGKGDAGRLGATRRSGRTDAQGDGSRSEGASAGDARRHPGSGPAIAKCTRTVEHVTALDAATALSAAAGGDTE